jgi:hypothetical protein
LIHVEVELLYLLFVLTLKLNFLLDTCLFTLESQDGYEYMKRSLNTERKEQKRRDGHWRFVYNIAVVSQLFISSLHNNNNYNFYSSPSVSKKIDVTLILLLYYLVLSLDLSLRSLEAPSNLQS